MPKKNSEQAIYICCHCDEPHDSLDQFYRINSGLYAKRGYLPICKKHFAETLEKYTEKYGDTRKAMRRICMAFDLYYTDSVFDSCVEDDVSVMLGNYFKRLNMKQCQKKTFDTSLEEGFDFEQINYKAELEKKKKAEKLKAKEEIKIEPEEEEEEKINPKDIEKWGIGFDNIDYGILNAHYKLLKSANPNCDSNQEIFINELCYTKMQQLKSVREGNVDDYNKLTDSYRKTFQQAGLKTTQESAKTSDDCWSTFVGIVSQYTPEEFYKNKKLYKDYDGLGEYYERFAVRPLRNIELGTQERDYEFYVHEDGDENEN